MRRENEWLLTRIKIRHYLWCKKNGRCVKWYDREKRIFKAKVKKRTITEQSRQIVQREPKIKKKIIEIRI